MPGRKQDCIWLYFEKEVQSGKTGCKAKCRECGRVMQGLVARMKAHHSECQGQNPQPEAAPTPRKRPAADSDYLPASSPAKRSKTDTGNLIALSIVRMIVNI